MTMITQQTNTNPVADELQVDSANVIGSRLGRMDPAIFSNQSGAAIEDDDELESEQSDNDEPTDEEGDPTGEHDHHQDDNYALGGHVTRSGSV